MTGDDLRVGAILRDRRHAVDADLRARFAANADYRKTIELLGYEA